MAPQSRVLFGRKAEGQPGGEGERGRTALSCGDEEGGVMFSWMACGRSAAVQARSSCLLSLRHWIESRESSKRGIG